MMVYRRQRTQPFKYILALIIFILALTVTFDDVEGFNLPTDTKGGGSITDSTTMESAVAQGDGGVTVPPDRSPTTLKTSSPTKR